MAIQALGAPTFSINDGTGSTLLQDFELGGNVFEAAFSNNETSRTNATNGGVTVSNRSDKDVMTINVRCQRDGVADRYFRTRISTDPGAAPVIFSGSITQQVRRDGTVIVAKISLSAGSIMTKPTYNFNEQDADNARIWGLEFRTGLEGA